MTYPEYPSWYDHDVADGADADEDDES